jgi:DNA polymerase III subunit delta'
MMITEPQRHTFDTIIGHEVIKRYLRAALRQSALPHAILLHGPRGLGKTSMAHALAKAANCSRGASDKCGCETCRKITDGVFADLLVVGPRGAAGQITLSGWRPGKDDPDDLQYYRFVDCRPIEGARKVLIIRQAERMNVSLGNCLLKLIEEPPSYLLIILLTHRPGDLLTTIRSRCAPVKFSPLGGEEIRVFAKMAAADAQDQNVEALAELSEGRPGHLLELLAETSTQTRAGIAQQMRFFQQYGFIGLFRAASELLKAAGGQTRGGPGAAENFEAVLNAMQAWLRDAAIAKAASGELADRLIANSDLKGEVHAYADSGSLDGIVAAADTVHAAYSFVPRQTDKNYVLETMLMQIGRAMR